MSKHYANASWEGTLVQGKGRYTLKTSGYEGQVRYSTRFEDDKSASSPEELIGAALSTCFSMAFAQALDQAGHKPDIIDVAATVTLAKTGDGFSITEIFLKTSSKVPGIDQNKYLEIAEKTKSTCPVSRALTGTKIVLEAELV